MQDMSLITSLSWEFNVNLFGYSNLYEFIAKISWKNCSIQPKAYYEVIGANYHITEMTGINIEAICSAHQEKAIHRKTVVTLAGYLYFANEDILQYTEKCLIRGYQAA